MYFYNCLMLYTNFNAFRSFIYQLTTFLSKLKIKTTYKLLSRGNSSLKCYIECWHCLKRDLQKNISREYNCFSHAPSYWDVSRSFSRNGVGKPSECFLVGKGLAKRVIVWLGKILHVGLQAFLCLLNQRLYPLSA